MSFVFDIAAAKQAKGIGKFNQAVKERNATIAEQEGEQIEKRLEEFDLPRFEEQFSQLQGKTKTAILKSGVDLSGSGLRILRRNAEQAEIEKNVMAYDAQIGKSRKFEEANFLRMQGSLAKMQAKQVELGYYAKAGKSLMTMSGGFGGGGGGSTGGFSGEYGGITGGSFGE